MDSLPPNDPNNNNNNNNQPNAGAAKEAPYDGRARNKRGLNPDGTMDVFGDMNDGGVAVVMFVMGVATWFLRERCIC